DDEEAAVPGDALERAVGDVAADGIVDDVGAAAAGRLLHGLDPVAARVVDGDVGAGAPGDLELLGPAGRRNDVRAERLPDLHRGDADAAGGGVHEEVLAAQELGPKDEACVRRRID